MPVVRREAHVQRAEQHALAARPQTKVWCSAVWPATSCAIVLRLARTRYCCHPLCAQNLHKGVIRDNALYAMKLKERQAAAAAAAAGQQQGAQPAQAQ